MDYLIDTHVFLWAASDPAHLSPAAAEACQVGQLWLSVASIWEIAIKVQIGRLQIPAALQDFIGRHLRIGQISVLPIHARHAFRQGELPLHHRDPFDRILIAQSLEESLPLISCDPLLDSYPIERVW
ncbi:MAG: type II toxin-antitoxin system VapC family toxin [Chloroflexota bacterium]|nr:type II toxin-antitoxin system VapC family toxin [Chloroflexota bacterium]